MSVETLEQFIDRLCRNRWPAVLQFLIEQPIAMQPGSESPLLFADDYNGMYSQHMPHAGDQLAHCWLAV